MVIYQKIVVNHGKITKMRILSQIKNWSLYYNFFEDNTVWDFSYLKTWFKQEKFVFPMYWPCSKTHKPWLEKKDVLCIIQANLGEIGLCCKNKFDQRVPFFDIYNKRQHVVALFITG